MDYVGIFHVLAVTPLWITVVILYFFSEGMIYLLRELQEGLGYQVAWSAKFGDAGLVAAVMIAITILQRGNALIPTWLQSGQHQMMLYALFLLIAVMASAYTVIKGVRSRYLADIYHDVVIVPVLAFLAFTLIPVIWYNALPYEAIIVVIAAIIWAVLIYVDKKQDRLDQRKWLAEHGINLKM